MLSQCPERWSGRGVLSFLLLNKSLPLFHWSFINFNNFYRMSILDQALYQTPGYSGNRAPRLILGGLSARVPVHWAGYLPFALQIHLYLSVLKGWPHHSLPCCLAPCWTQPLAHWGELRDREMSEVGGLDSSGLPPTPQKATDPSKSSFSNFCNFNHLRHIASWV